MNIRKWTRDPRIRPAIANLEDYLAGSDRYIHCGAISLPIINYTGIMKKIILLIIGCPTLNLVVSYPNSYAV